MTEKIDDAQLKADMEVALQKPGDTGPVEKEEGSEPNYSEIELEAIDNGWNPEGVEGKPNLTAEEFMGRKPLYDKIHGLERKTKRLDDAFKALQSHQDHIRKQEREKVMEELLERKKEAISIGDGDAVVDIDNKIYEERARATQEEKPTVNEDFEDWSEANPWYKKDKDLQAYADFIGTRYAGEHPDLSLSEVYDFVSDKVKEQFPDKFSNTRRTRPNSVEEASAGRASRPAGKTERDLPDFAREIMYTLIQSGATTKEQYLKEYFDVES